MAEEGGLYCSTSGTYFTDKQSLQDHYRSSYHQYNLKRKVAGLPPVTREWFEARRQQLQALSQKPKKKIYIDTVTGKKFGSLRTYQNFISSKKYSQLVKGLDTIPDPIIKELQESDSGEKGVQQQQPRVQKGSQSLPYKLKEVAGLRQVREDGQDPAELVSSSQPNAGDDVSEGDVTDSEGSEDGSMGPAQMEPWPLNRSLFDNHESADLEANLAYMYKHYAFYVPDAEYLVDPEGLLRYLGAKLQYAHIPLHVSGTDPDARRFASLHAVQRHMVDTSTCRMLYDDNEEEYEEYYDYSAQHDSQEEQEAEEKRLVLADDAEQLQGTGLELAVAGDSANGGVKYLGSREFAKYYKQKPRPVDTRASVSAASLVAAYRRLGLVERNEAEEVRVKVFARRAKQQQREQLRREMRSNVNNHLPRNVPY